MVIRKFVKKLLHLGKRSTDNMPVSRDAVVWGYRLFLGREPESEKVIRGKLNCKNMMELREQFAGSLEFISSGLSKGRPFLPLSWGVKEDEVDTDASDAELNECIAKIKEVWVHLGKNRAHFSVLTGERFLPANLSGNIDEFWASGEGNAATVDSILARHGMTLCGEMTCIEYGCGVGRVTSQLARRFGRIHAYDISAPHIAYAEQRVKEIGAKNVTFHLCSDNLLESLQTCDVFYSRIVFQHNPPPVIAQLIRNALRSLNEGGIAIFQVPTFIRDYQFNVRNWLLASHALDMQMHCIPQPTVFRIVIQENCSVLEVREDPATGEHDKYISNTFVIRKKGYSKCLK